MTLEPTWLRAARADIGQTETLGPNDSPWIRAMLAKLAGGGLWLVGQPWCGGAAAFWMQNAGLKIPKAWYRAKAWLDWGVPQDVPLVGSIVVFEREGGGHVGLVVGQDSRGRLLVLGGNQSDAVRILPFDRARVLGYRWPSDALSVTGTPLPVYVNGAASSSNEA